MALLYADGFEHGRSTVTTGLISNVGITQSISTTTVRTGTRAFRASAGTSNSGYFVPSIASGATYVVVMYFRYATSLPAADVVLLRAQVAAGTNGDVSFNQSSGKMMVNYGATEADFGPTIVADTWYRLTLKLDASANPHAMTAAIDGANANTVSIAQAASSYTNLYTGNVGSGTTVDLFIDDYIVTDTLTDYDYFLPRAHKVEALIPNADGSHNITTSGDFDSFTTTQFDNSTTNGYTFIAHRPIQFANTAEQVVRQELGLSNIYMEFLLENLTADTYEPFGVYAFASLVQSGSAGTSPKRVVVRTGTGADVSPDVILTTDDPGTTVTGYGKALTAPGGGWLHTTGSAGSIDDLRVRVGFGDAQPRDNFIDFMLQVALAETLAGDALDPFGMNGIYGI